MQMLIVSAKCGLWLCILLALGAVPARAQTGEARKIALLLCNEPERYISEDFTRLVHVYTPYGNTTYSRDGDKPSIMLTHALLQQRIAIGAVLTDALESSLRARGFDVSRVQAGRSKVNELVHDYKPLVTDADVILDVVITHVGYTKSSKTPGFTPSMRIEAQLVSSQGRRKVFKEAMAYGWYTWSKEHPRPDPKYIFNAFDEMIADGARAKEGLESGMRPLADLVVAKIQGRAAKPASDEAPASDSTPFQRDDTR